MKMDTALRRKLEFSVMHRILDEKGLEPLSPRHAQFGGDGWRLARERVLVHRGQAIDRLPAALLRI